MNAMVDFFSALRIGTPRTVGGITMIPLSSDAPSRLRYLTVGEALARNLVDITEVGSGGHVPEVHVTSRADRPVLFLDGDALIGAKQNRVLNLSVLVAAESTTVVPVSCVEAGRWSPASPSFSSGDALHFASARGRRMADVSLSMHRTGTRRSDQSRVWEDMAAYSADLRVRTASGAMQDIFESVRTPVENVLGQLGIEPGQRGAAFVVDGRLLGLDVLSSEVAFANVFPKLVRSYAVEVQRRSGASADKPIEVSEDLARSLVHDALARMHGATWQDYAGAGIGSDLRLSLPELNAGALVYDEEVIHLAAFAGESSRVAPRGGRVRVRM
jgi:hypothetical protein